MGDPYGTLGVRPDATDEEIAKAYKHLAKRYHPDLNPNNAAAAERMGRINQAYDEIKRLRQSGNRQNSRPSPGTAYGAADPFTAYYQSYRRSAADDYSAQYHYHRRSSPFRVAMAVMLAILLLGLFAVLLSGTAPYERFVHGVPAASDEPPAFYGFYHTYP